MRSIGVFHKITFLLTVRYNVERITIALGCLGSRGEDLELDKFEYEHVYPPVQTKSD